MLDVVVVRPRFVAWKPGGQRFGRLCPVDDREDDQREADEDGEPDEKTATLHTGKLIDSHLNAALGTRAFASPASRHPVREALAAESISLSSTGPDDLRLPPTAFASGFDLLALRARRKRESRRGQVLPQVVKRRKERNLQGLNCPHFHSRPCSLWKEAPAPSFRVSHMPPHMPRPPSIDHGVISFLWAVGLGAYIYFGSLAVGVSSGTAFVFAALAAFAIFLYVRIFGEDTPPRRGASGRRTSRE